MHKGIDDIEQRLNDFIDFEHEVSEDVWDGIEHSLFLNKSIQDLSNFEYEVSNDIWEGIEERLTVKRPKTAIWWLPSSIAAMLILALGISSLNDINIQNEKTNALALTEDVKGSSAVVSSTQNINNSAQNTDINSTKGTIPNSSEVNNNENGIKNSSDESTSKATEVTSPSSVNMSNNNSESKLIALNNNATAKNSTPVNNKNLTENITTSSPSPNNANPVNTNQSTSNARVMNSSNESKLSNTTLPTDNKNIENTSVITTTEESSTSSMLPNALSKQQLIENEKEDEEHSLMEEPIIAENVDEVLEEEEGKPKVKKWQLIALGGAGNFRNITQNHDVGGVPPEPSTKGPAIPVEKQFKPVTVDGKEGLNAINYQVPINLSLNGQRSISDRVALRVGVTYTQLKNNFQIYFVDYSLQLNYIAIPVSGVITLKEWEKVKWNALVNTRSEKMISHKFVNTPDFDTYYLPDELEVEYSGFNVLVGLGSEINFELSKNVSLTTNTQINKYLQNDSQQDYIRNKQSFWPEANIGIIQKF